MAGALGVVITTDVVVEGRAAVPVYVDDSLPIVGPSRAIQVVTSGPMAGGPAIPVRLAPAGTPAIGPALPVYVVAGGGALGVSAPVNTALPVISGTLNLGQLLSTTNGTWANGPTSYAYQWKRNGANIGGATNNTYTVISADLGTTITVAVTATNTGGSTAATSTGVVIFIPTSLNGLQLWLKADTLALNNNDPVSSWADSSGLGRTMSQASGTLQPLFLTNQVNGLPAVDFDGSDNYMRTGVFTLAQPYTLFLVLRLNTWTSVRRLYDGQSVNGTGYIRQTGVSPNMQAAASATGPASNALTLATWGLTAVVYNGASSTLAINGGADVTGNTGTGTPNGITLGGAADGSIVSDFTVAELLIYDSVLSAGNQASVKAYLNAKYILY